MQNINDDVSSGEICPPPPFKYLSTARHRFIKEIVLEKVGQFSMPIDK